MSRLHLGINTCFAVKRWPEAEQWVRIVKDELGLDCCQFSFDLVDPLLDEKTTKAYAKELRKLAELHNLFIHSTFTGLAAYSWSQLLHPLASMREAAEAWYQRAIDFTSHIGATGMGGHIGAFSVQDAHDHKRRQMLLQEMIERLSELSRYAAHKGLSHLLFENMAVTREFGYSIEEAQQLTNLNIHGGVPLILCLDVGHPCALHTGTASDNYLAWLATSWQQLPIVHLQQTDRSGDHHWPFTKEYNTQGVIKAEKVIEAIQPWLSIHDVYLFLELIHPFEAQDSIVLNELRESVEYWREAIS